MLQQLKDWGIKAIIWDVDGTLVDLNKTYYNFITKHSEIRELKDKKGEFIFKNIKYKDLNKVIPVNKLYGAMELKTHPLYGEKLDKIFCNSNDFYFDRKFYKGTKKVLKQLNKLGYKQFILSAGFNIDKKMFYFFKKYYFLINNFYIN